MASRFATVSKDEILAVNEASAPTNTKKETQNLACRCLLLGRKKLLTEFAKKIIKMITETLSIAEREQTITK